MPTLRQQLIAQIQAAHGSGRDGLVEVAGAADVAAVLQGRISAPSAFIIRASDSRTDNGRTATIIDQFLVLTAVKNVRDARGGDSSDAAEAWAGKIERCFKGFIPVIEEGQFDELKRVRGNVLRWTEQILIWADTYQLKYRRRCCS